MRGGVGVEGKVGGTATDPSLSIFPHGAGFMNDLLIVDLMESGGPAK